MTLLSRRTFLLCILLAMSTQAEEWTGQRVIDQPITVSAPVLSILPGAKIVFQGQGRLIFRGQKLDIRGASFSATEVLPNAPRISLSNVAVDITDTTFTGLLCAEPLRFQQCFFNLYACTASIRNCTFTGCSSIDFSNSSGCLLQDCAFVNCPAAAHLYNSWKCLVVRCFFYGSSEYALRVTKAPLSKAIGNIFTDCALAIRIMQESDRSLFVRNEYFNTAVALRFSGGRGVSFTGERFQNITRVAIIKSAAEPEFNHCEYVDCQSFPPE
ncbi:MAG: right-handed parallel beta-helix repeat-containing protein [Oligosphaeraceae bacterium]|nr:right-handed parallel beta-helix repeat-containing protein [Oligosphaeraceae bacterium]